MIRSSIESRVLKNIGEKYEKGYGLSERFTSYH